MPIPFLIGAAISALGASAAAAGTIGTVTAAGAAAAGAAAAYKVKKGLDVREDLSQESIGVKSVFTTDEAMKVLGMSKPTILKKMKEANNRLDLCRLIPIVKLSKLTEKANKIGLI